MGEAYSSSSGILSQREMAHDGEPEQIPAGAAEPPDERTPQDTGEEGGGGDALAGIPETAEAPDLPAARVSLAGRVKLLVANILLLLVLLFVVASVSRSPRAYSSQSAPGALSTQTVGGVGEASTPSGTDDASQIVTALPGDTLPASPTPRQRGTPTVRAEPTPRATLSPSPQPSASPTITPTSPAPTSAPPTPTPNPIVG